MKYEFRLSSPLQITEMAYRPLPPHSAKSTNSARRKPAENWSGNVTYAEAVALSETGWTDAPQLGDLAEQIAPTETRTAHEMRHAVTGAFVDVSRYVEGHPEDMMEFCEEPAPRSFSLAVQIGRTGMVSPESMALAGAVALAVLDTLSRSGFAVELKGIVHGEEGRHSQLLTVPLKRAGEPADENQIAFWLSHPAAYRLLVFGFFDAQEDPTFYSRMDHAVGRGMQTPTTAAEVGSDYLIYSIPSSIEQARREYSRIIAEITSTL